MALIVVLRWAALRWLGLILALALGSGLAAHLPEVATLAGRFGALPDRLPWPALPDLAPGRVRELLPSALVIAFLAGIGALLSAVGADRMVLRARHRPDAELVAQGLANLGSALFGVLPAKGAIARSATNVRAGGRTQVAGMGPCAHGSGGDDAGRAAGLLHGDACACGASCPDGLEHVRTGQVAAAICAPPRQSGCCSSSPSCPRCLSHRQGRSVRESPCDF